MTGEVVQISCAGLELKFCPGCLPALSSMSDLQLPEREIEEREFNLSIQPALAYEDTSMLESSAKVRMAAKK